MIGYKSDVDSSVKQCLCVEHIDYKPVDLNWIRGRMEEGRGDD